MLTPQSEKKFKLATPDRLVEINDTRGMLYIIPDRDSIHYSKAEASIITNEYLEKYAGKYFSTETNSTLTVYLKDGKLMMNVKPNLDIELNPTYKDGFNFNVFRVSGNLYFKKDKIALMNVSVSRARNIVFEKLK